MSRRNVFKCHSTIKIKDTHSPVHPVCFHPSKAVLIDPEHQLQTASNTLHILRTLIGKVHSVRLKGILSHETKHMHSYRKSLPFYYSLLALEHPVS